MTPLEPPYRAGRKKHKGRLIPVLISSRNELSTHFHQRCDSCVNFCNLIHVSLQSAKNTASRTYCSPVRRSVCRNPQRNVQKCPILSWTMTPTCCFWQRLGWGSTVMRLSVLVLPPVDTPSSHSTATCEVVASPSFSGTACLHLSLHRPPSLSITLAVN